MPFCDRCGSKLPKSNSRFCPKCGSAVGGKAAQANLQGGTGAVKAAGSNLGWKVLGITLGLTLGCIILFGVMDNEGSSPLSTTSDYDGNPTSTVSGNEVTPSITTQICADKAGSVTCGYCDPDMALSGNPHADKCRYCPSGTTCSGEICSEELTCKKASQSPGGTATPATGDGGNGGNGGGGVLTNFPFDANTGCPVQGSTSSWGSSNLQCSQWIESQRCSIQSCQCYYSDAGGDTARAYYRTSDGAYFPCTGDARTGIDCRAAAEATALHCAPTSFPEARNRARRADIAQSPVACARLHKAENANVKNETLIRVGAYHFAGH